MTLTCTCIDFRARNGPPAAQVRTWNFFFRTFVGLPPGASFRCLHLHLHSLRPHPHSRPPSLDCIWPFFTGGRVDPASKQMAPILCFWFFDFYGANFIFCLPFGKLRSDWLNPMSVCKKPLRITEQQLACRWRVRWGRGHRWIAKSLVWESCN